MTATNAGRSGSPTSTLRVGIGHVFATGPRPRRDRLFHVGGLRLTSNTPPQTADWLIDPGCSVGRKAQRRSGVRAADLEGKPRWERVEGGDLRKFFADLDLLFVFDQEGEPAWFEEVVLAGAGQRPAIVDLRWLSALLLPGLPLYDPEALWRAVVPADRLVSSGARMPNALSAGLALLHRMIGRLLRDTVPTDRGHPLYSLLAAAADGPDADPDVEALVRVARGAHGLRWSDELFSFDEPKPIDLRALGRRGFTALIRPWLSDPAETAPARPSDAAWRPVSSERVSQAFGALEEAAAGFRSRSAQREYAEYVTEAVNAEGRYAIEAGTGTGKTLGYLVPACELVRTNPGSKVLIATATKNLQNQVATHELPRLKAAIPLYRDIRVAVLKGRGNYVCDAALADLFEELFGVGANDAERQLAWIAMLVLVLEGGGEFDGVARVVRDRLPALRDLREDVNAHSACSQEVCSLSSVCTYARERRHARDADIIVTNQHKLPFVGEILQTRARLCVIDEADEFPDNLRSARMLRISDFDVRRRIVNRLRGGRRRRGYADLLLDQWRRERLRQPQGESLADLNTCIDAAERILARCQTIDETLDAVRTCTSGPSSGGAVRWSQLQDATTGERLAEYLQRLATDLEEISGEWTRVLGTSRYEVEGNETIPADRRRRLQAERIRIERYRSIVGETGAEARLLASDYPSPEFVHTLKWEARWWTASRTPLDLSHGLEGALPYPTTIFTSATLAVNDTLDLFERDLGLEHPLDNVWRIPSEFDYRKNVIGAVTTYIPSFRYNDAPDRRRAWMELAERTISALCVAMDGRTLVLFTSRLEMRDMYARIAPVLLRHDIEPMIQEGASAAEINAFRAYEHSVLFGVDRFWKGVDFAGPTLSQVIMVRLPNPSLSDPLIEHRLETMGPAFWEEFYHPATRLKFKQGFGRLIRSESDRGLFVVLDRRILDDTRMAPMQEELPIRLEPVRHFRSARDGNDLLDLATRGLKRAGLYFEFEDRGVDIYS